MTLAALAATTAVEQSPAEAASRSLQVSPSTYVAGQNLTWTGNVGARGVRSFVLQLNMARPGDKWTTIPNLSGKTRSDGSFRFNFRAPGMFDILYRVKAGKYTSTTKNFSAKTADITLAVTGQEDSGLVGDPGFVDPGRPFGITADATPDGIFRSPSSDNVPVFPGRVLTLLKRVDGDTWTAVARTKEDSRGNGYFANLTEPAGISVYRVRQEAVTTGGNAIGSHTSFPMYVLSGRAAEDTYYAAQDNAPSSDVVAPAYGGGGVRATPTAASTQGWYPVLYDFDFEAGQSLESPSGRGSNTKARWLEYTDGSGRAIKHNGGILLDSKRYNGAGYGDFGTTRATVTNAGASQGRWEARMRVRSAFERGGNSYRILAELVPSNPAQYACGNRNITIASINPFTRTFTYGARNATTRWTGSANATNVPVHASDAYGVELMGNRITWFLNGKPIGSVTDTAALPRVPMTFRFSLEGKGQQEMDEVSLISDWVRGFPIKTGKHPISKNLLRKSAAAPAAC